MRPQFGLVTSDGHLPREKMDATHSSATARPVMLCAQLDAHTAHTYPKVLVLLRIYVLPASVSQMCHHV